MLEPTFSPENLPFLSAPAGGFRCRRRATGQVARMRSGPLDLDYR